MLDGRRFYNEIGTERMLRIYYTQSCRRFLAKAMECTLVLDGVSTTPRSHTLIFILVNA